MLRKLLLLSAVLLILGRTQAQTEGQNTAVRLPSGYLNQVSANADRMKRQLTQQSEKYLKGMEQAEQRVMKKMDSNSARRVFGDIAARYSQLQQKMAAGKSGLPENAAGAYIPAVDSLKSTLQFLQAHAELISKDFSPEKLQAVLDKVQGLQNRLNMAEGLKDYLQQRQQYLSGEFNKLGLGTQLSVVNKKAYYYKQQLTDLKASLKDPSSMQKKAVQALTQVPAYRQFLQRHSFLASIFGAPEDYQLSDSGMKQMQTRASVQKMIQEKVGAGGPGGEQQVMQQVQQSGAELSALRSKLLSLSSKADPTDPGFKPNTQKTKSLWKRLEYGADLQFESSTALLPTIADVGVSLGYKLNDKATIGAGAAFKMGLGDGLNHIHFSGQGLGLRSYIDWQLKKNFYLSGGYERNYLNEFQSISQLGNGAGWQSSGLIGISRKYRLSNKVNGKLQLLFDLLSQTHLPVSTPIVFRTGWSF